MLTRSSSFESRTVVEPVRWDTYVALADERAGIVPRLTFDRGRMELISPKKEHESIGHLLGRLIETFSECRDIEIVGVASTTFRRQDLDRGFEADEAYYIEHADAVRGQGEIDLAIDPPPDLVIETELTSSAIRKLDLLAAMGIPEFWRHNGEELRVFLLDGPSYRPSSTSCALPGFPLPLAHAVLARRHRDGETALIREFRKAISSR